LFIGLAVNGVSKEMKKTKKTKQNNLNISGELENK